MTIVINLIIAVLGLSLVVVVAWLGGRAWTNPRTLKRATCVKCGRKLITGPSGRCYDCFSDVG